ncbi:MAG: peptidoglycan DD-metalloendopeptidase family protein [Ruminococcus sp.]|nr:peptidoglycan DD-metalloendopeptidase family protein [Ruminococcus sp.]
MKTKFIGLDGFNEIETVTSKERLKKYSHKSLKKFARISKTLISEAATERKEKRSARKAAKPSRVELHYMNQRKQGSQKLSTSAIAVSRAHSVRNKALRHSGQKPSFLKGKVALGLATSFVAVSLCIFASANTMTLTALASEKNTVAKDKTTSTVKVNDTELSKTVHTELSESMSEGEILSDGYGLYIDKQLVGVSLDKDELKAELDKLLEEHKAKYDDTTTDEFNNEVEIVYGSYKSKYIDDSEKIVSNNKDKFSFILYTDYETVGSLDYDIEVKYDDSKYEDYSKVTQKGKEGKVKYIYRLTYVDGVQTDSVLKEEKVLKEPVTKIITEGTKERPVEVEEDDSDNNSSSNEDSQGSGTSSGGFIWPLPYTSNVTSGYGARWGRFHSGIDIAAGGCYGQSIVAADGGTVEWAGYDSSGYGNYVIINHGNGYKTLYGHCSSLYVSAGQSVSQGQSIAAVGSTGDSTGPHLHFEVRTSGGERLNPANFV